MVVATSEEIAALELLTFEVERAHAQLRAVELERSRELLAVELELASAVSIVEASAARALFVRREISETGHTSRLPIDEIGQCIDASHERVESTLETLTVTGFHWKWSEGPKTAYTRETSCVPDSGGVL